MDVTMAAALFGLALVDSTSFGTLGVPALMLTQPVIRARLLLTYLAALSIFYWLLGAALLAGVDRAVSANLEWLPQGPGLVWAQVLVGSLLFGLSFVLDRRGRAWLARRRADRGLPPRPARRAAWRDKVIGPQARPRTMVGVALTAGAIEAASMVPYLAAIALLTASELSAAATLAVLGVYAVVMCLPALGLLAARVWLHERIAPTLGRVDAWMTRTSGDALAWVLGILGVLMVVDGIPRLA